MKVLVIAARGLRAQALGCYGNPWIDTPALDSLAAQGVVFDRHLADCASSAGAHRTWRSGRYQLPAPPGESAAAPPAGPDLVATLRSQGVFTTLLLDASRPYPTDFAEGWDDVELIGAGQTEGSVLEAILERAQEQLEALQEQESWLLWLDLGTALPPWDVPEDFQAPYFQEEATEEDEEAEEEEESEEDEEEPAEPLLPLPDPVPGLIDPADDTLYLRLWSSYAAAVSYLDAGVGQLMEQLAEDEGEDVVVLLTADVGQSLGEHGVVGPVRPWLYDERVHLPLLLRLPDEAEAGRRSAALTQSVDLAPTLADLFGVALPDAHGHSLLPLVHGQTERLRDYACSGAEVDGNVEWSLRTLEMALMVPLPADPDARPAPRLYILPDDFWQVNDVVQHYLDLADGLARTLHAFVTATCQTGPLQAPALPDPEAEAKEQADEPASEPGSS